LLCKKCNNIIKINSNFIKSRLHRNNTICINCNPIKSFSENEKKLIEILETNNISYIPKDRAILRGKEIDILIPKYKLGIEHNGLFWHGTMRQKDNKYHLKKTNNCNKRGIKLFHIFEDEINDQFEIVESMIKSELNIYDRIININDCEIKEINNSFSIRKYLNENDIHGYCRFAIKLGLFYNDELVSLLILNKKK
jgi:G:T-mismatch repair DNA endonuclease (very short patch repair protein)